MSALALSEHFWAVEEAGGTQQSDLFWVGIPEGLWAYPPSTWGWKKGESVLSLVGGCAPNYSVSLNNQPGKFLL